MIKNRSVCLAYETVEKADRSLPLLVPMSEVAGRMSVQQGAKYLEKPMGGLGVLLGGVPGVKPAEVIVLGGGIVGTQAAKMAAGLGVGDVAVIFPEGSRASGKKRTRAIERLRERAPERAARLEGLRYLIAPKPAGASALLNAVPHANIVTMWHSGFDGLDTFSGIVRHLGNSKARVHVRVQEYERSTIPTGDAFTEWLDNRWVEMDAAVANQLQIEKS